jgi:hypothetical protein
MTVIETFKGHKLVAVTARSNGRRTHKAVVVGTGSISIGAGQTQTMRIALNRTGRRLLARRHELKARLRVTQATAKSGVVTVSTQTVTFKPAKEGRHQQMVCAPTSFAHHLDEGRTAPASCWEAGAAASAGRRKRVQWLLEALMRARRSATRLLKDVFVVRSCHLPARPSSFFVVRPVNARMARRKTSVDVESETRPCTECLSDIAVRHARALSAPRLRPA